MASSGFSWWLERLATQLERFDMLRIDHFRAFESYWAVPAGASTARDGSWRQGFGARLLAAFQARYGQAVLVAEDLGLITDEVRALRDRFGLPGMAVLQFAFDGSPDNPHLPANCGRRVVMYTGTHDNDTTVGWYSGLEPATRDLVAETLRIAHVKVPETFIDAVYACDAQLAMIPMQDLLGLGREARMNTPGTLGDNWQWRFSWKQLDPAHAERALARAERHSRRVATDGSPV
jgi:4-alpha-glucanotransferase